MSKRRSNVAVAREMAIVLNAMEKVTYLKVLFPWKRYPALVAVETGFVRDARGRDGFSSTEPLGSSPSFFQGGPKLRA
jgi:hypothetical protein